MPLHAHCGKSDAETLAAKLASLSLASIVKHVGIEQFAAVKFNGAYRRRYQLSLSFHNIERYPDELHLTAEGIAATVTGPFRKLFRAYLGREVANAFVSAQVQESKETSVKASTPSHGDEEEEDGNAAQKKRARRSKNSHEDDEEEEDEENVAEDMDRAEQREQQRHKEQEYFDEPDDEDQELVMEIDKQQRQEDAKVLKSKQKRKDACTCVVKSLAC